MQAIAARSSTVVVMTELTKRMLENAFFISENVRVIPHGVAIGEEAAVATRSERRERLRAQLGALELLRADNVTSRAGWAREDDGEHRPSGIDLSHPFPSERPPPPAPSRDVHHTGEDGYDTHDDEDDDGA